ncbi:MAG: QsdR family transcriptional regulator [Oceanococcus sp.]
MRKATLAHTKTATLRGSRASEAFELARKNFLEGRRVEMGALAEQLGVSRITVNRWLGKRHELLADILWSLASSTLIKEMEAQDGVGSARIAKALAKAVAATIDNPGMQAFLDSEGETAMRLATSFEGGMQTRLITLIQSILQKAVDAGTYTPQLDLGELAYAVVRIGESFIYRRFITGEPPHAESLEPLYRLLLANG